MRSRWFGFVLAALAGIASLAVYDRLPPEVPIHWNLRGEPDGYGSRLFAALFGPLLLVGLTLFLQVLPGIDPRGERFARVRGLYWGIVNITLGYLLVLHLAVLANGAGAPVSVVHTALLGLVVATVVSVLLALVFWKRETKAE